MPPKDTGTGSAGSKAILTGEHAVVYGGRAIVLGLCPGVTATARRTTTRTQLTVAAWNYSVCISENATAPIGARSLCAIFDALGIADQTCEITATAAIPPRAGLGASASLATATARALADLYGIADADGRIEEAVAASESIFHQTPSGVDAAAVRRCGIFSFRKKQGVSALEGKRPPVALVHSGEPGATSDTIRVFKEFVEKHPATAQACMARIDALADLATRALAHADWPSLGQIMNENHEILQRFGVSSPGLDDICAIARNHGALGAKLTGGGGGGCALVLPGNRRDAVLSALTTAGYEVVMRHV
jgi:hydroxymethylglutaryl-CoA reductase